MFLFHQSRKEDSDSSGDEEGGISKNKRYWT
jgi:hypothetical protein